MYLFSLIIIICIFVLFSKISDLTSKVRNLEGLNKHLQKELVSLKELFKSATSNPNTDCSETLDSATQPQDASSNRLAEQRDFRSNIPVQNTNPASVQNNILNGAMEQIEQLTNASPWVDPIKQIIGTVSQEPIAEKSASKEPLAKSLPLQKDKETSFSLFSLFAKNWIPVSGAAFIFVGLAYALIAANVSISFFVGLAYFIFSLLFGASVSQNALDFIFKSHSKDESVQTSAQISAGVSVGLLYLTTFIANTVLNLFSTNTAFILYFLTSAALFKVSIFSEKPSKVLTAIGFIGAYLSPILTFKVYGSWSSSLAFNLIYAYILLAFSLYVSLRNRWLEIALLSQTMAGVLAGNALIFAHYIGAPLLVKEFGVLLVIGTLLAWLIRYTKTNSDLTMSSSIEKIAVYSTTTVSVLLSLVATGLVVNHPIERVLGAVATVLIFGVSIWTTRHEKWLHGVLKAASAIVFASLVALSTSFMPSEFGFVLIFLEGLLLLKMAEPASFLRTKLIWPLCTVPMATLLLIGSPLTGFVMFALLAAILFGSDKFKLGASPIFQAICAIVSFLFLGAIFKGIHVGIALVTAALVIWAFILHTVDRHLSRHVIQKYLHFALFWGVSFLPLAFVGSHVKFFQFLGIIAIQYVVLLGYFRIEKFIYSPQIFLGILSGSLIGYGFVVGNSAFMLLVCSAFFLGSSYFFGRVNLLMLDKTKADSPVAVVNAINRVVAATCAAGMLFASSIPGFAFANIAVLFILGAYSLYYETYKVGSKPFVQTLDLSSFKWHIVLFASFTWLGLLALGGAKLLIGNSVSATGIILPFTVIYTVLMCSALRTASSTKNVQVWLFIAAALGVNILAMIALIQGLSNKIQIGIPFLIIGFALLWAGFVAPKPGPKQN